MKNNNRGIIFGELRLIGFPKGYAFNLTEIFENPPKDTFFSEQGFTALNFA